MDYALKQAEAIVLHVGLDIRLADGKLGGVYISDYRPLLKGQRIPPAPSKEEIFEAVLLALSERPDTARVQNLRPVVMNRRLSCEEDRFSCYYSMDLRGDTPEGKTLVIIANYYEATQRAKILNVYDQAELDRPWKPFATVADQFPVWTADGKGVYFVTHRDWRGRPWWQRGSLAPSIAFCRMDDQPSESLVCLRPIKPLGADFMNYTRVAPSPSGRFLAGTYDTGHRHLFLLDLEQGRLSLTEETKLVDVEDLCWLPGESGLLVSAAREFPDTDLFSVHWNPDHPLTDVEGTRLRRQRGEERLPTLSRDGRWLAYARRDQEGEQWQIVVVDFDATTLRMGTKSLAVSVAGEPCSLSWDARNQRLLVVIAGRMAWIRRGNGNLHIEEVPHFRDGEVRLTIHSAAISPDGERIVCAAILNPPLIREEREVRVASNLYLWDGHSPEMRRLLDPFQIGLGFYTFPGTSSRFARLQGDPERGGLAQIADPEWITLIK